MTFIPNTILYAAQLNSAFAGKANLDPVTGKVRTVELPDIAAIADEQIDARMPAINADIQAAQETADQALADAAVSDSKAVAAQDTADDAMAAAAVADAKAVVADGKAVTAQTTADQAVSDAAVADGKAVAAQDTADDALAAAAVADAKAVTAQTTADQAVSDAAVADGKAVAAQDTADDALAAAAVADAKAVVADGKAVTAQDIANTRIPTSEKGVANGVATLDAMGKVPIAQIPDGISGGGGSSGPQIRARCNLNGATNTIRQSFNIASVTNVATGVFIFNFTNPMSNRHYSYALSGKFDQAIIDSTHAMISEQRGLEDYRQINQLRVICTFQPNGAGFNIDTISLIVVE